MGRLAYAIKEQKLLDMEVDFSKFLKENNISDEAIMYRMDFDKKVFSEEKEVREYLEMKGYYETVIEEEDENYIALLNTEGQMDLESMVEVELRRGCKVYAANLKQMPAMEDIEFNEDGGIKLAVKTSSIDLNAGVPHIIEVAKVAKGYHPAYGEVVITQEDLESMVNNYKLKATGVDLAVNEDHKKGEAFAWFKEVFLSYDKQTLLAQVVWNTKGIQALSNKEYRYFSPELKFNYVHPHTGIAYGPTLLGGALTNYPFLKMDAIIELNNKTEKTERLKMDKQTIELSAHTEKVVELNGKIVSLNEDIKAKELELSTTKAENVELSNKVKELEASIEENKKKATHEKLFNEGKINKAQLDALNEGKGLLEVIALNEKFNTTETGKGNNSTKEIVLSEKEKAACKDFGLTEEEFIAANYK